MAKNTWKYACMDCGRKMRDESTCPRCVKMGLPGDRVGKMCCNTCGHTGEWDGDLLFCKYDSKPHEIGYVCDHWKNMEM